MNPNTAQSFYGQKLSKQGINVANASDKQLLWKDDYNNNVKTWYDGSNSRILQGKLPDGSYGMWVSKPGTDVSSANTSQLIFNSNQDIFKIVKKTTTSVPSFTTTYNGSNTSGGTLLTIAHGLSFTPIVDIYVQAQLWNLSSSLIASSYIRLPIFISGSSTQILNSYWFPGTGGNVYPMSVIYAVDATNVYVQAFYEATGSSADTIQPIPVTIFYLQETAT